MIDDCFQILGTFLSFISYLLVRKYNVLTRMILICMVSQEHSLLLFELAVDMLQFIIQIIHFFKLFCALF